MSGPKMGSNPKKIPFGSNVSRPTGCAVEATSLDPITLHYAASTGNRATRRLATRNLIKQALNLASGSNHG